MMMKNLPSEIHGRIRFSNPTSILAAICRAVSHLSLQNFIYTKKEPIRDHMSPFFI